MKVDGKEGVIGLSPMLGLRISRGFVGALLQQALLEGRNGYELVARTPDLGLGRDLLSALELGEEWP